jgi:quinolinate synthase
VELRKESVMKLCQNSLENTHFSAESLYDKLKNITVDNPLCTYSLERCQRLFPKVEAILQLKKERNALILAHSYVHPDIIYGVADHTGDSYNLAKAAKNTHADRILFPAVRFMAETAKILNPTTIVIDPNPNGGCTLADSIDVNTVLKLREKYPRHTFVCYINTTAAIKAVCDVCVTSSNVYKIVEQIPNDKIYFLPDRLMGQNIENYLKEKKIDKELLYTDGTCYVHEEFEPEQIDHLKMQHPALTVLAHPECKPEVARKADVICSTTGMIDYVKIHGNKTSPFLLLTECGIASRLQAEDPTLQLVGSCSLCRYMRSNSLEAIYQALKEPKPSQVIEIDANVQKEALRCIQAMFHYAEMK